VKHIVDIITSVTSQGFTGKMTEMSKYSDHHRTTIRHFLSRGKWDDGRLEEALSYKCHEYIQQSAREKDIPIFMSIDDTVNPKKKPSRAAERPMEGGAFVYSYLLGKTVWGYQVMTALISDGDTALCYKVGALRQKRRREN